MLVLVNFVLIWYSAILCGFFQGIIFLVCIVVFVLSLVSLGVIVSYTPLEELSYKGWNGAEKAYTSPYASTMYIGWAMTSAIALTVTGMLPVISWFSTYRFSASSGICLVLFARKLPSTLGLLIMCLLLVSILFLAQNCDIVCFNFWPSGAVILVAFCGTSFMEVVSSRIDHIPTNGDFLAALLPMLCIPAFLSLCTGLHKW